MHAGQNLFDLIASVVLRWLSTTGARDQEPDSLTQYGTGTGLARVGQFGLLTSPHKPMASGTTWFVWFSTICLLVFLARDIGTNGDIFKACGGRLKDHIFVPPQPDCKHNMLEQFQHFVRPNINGPVQAPCNFQWFTRTSACKALKPFKNIIFAGDSLTRGIFDSLLMILRGDLAYGGLSSQLHPLQADQCSCEGAHRKKCRLATASWTDIDHTNMTSVWHAVQNECGVDIELFHMYHHYADTGTVDAILNRLKENQDSQLFLGALPLHAHCQGCPKLDSGRTIANIMQPLLAEISPSRILFGLMHSHKNHKVPIEWRQGQDVADVLLYNQVMWQYCQSATVPVFDSYAATSNVSTLDGVHHTAAVNVIKAQVFLNYLDTSNAA